MREKEAAKQLTPKQAGLLSSLLFMLLKLLYLSFLAWLVLLVGFLVIAICQGQVLALQQAETIVLRNTHFIATRSALFASLLTRGFDRLQLLLAVIDNGFTFFNSDWITTLLQLLMTVTEIILTRLIIFILALPLFLLILFVAVTDGLVKRDIRKFQGARESTFLFHRLKWLTGWLLLAPFFLSLSWPFAANPLIFLIAQSVLLGMAMMLATTHFKKYL